MASKFNWKTLIPFYGLYETVKNIENNTQQDGSQFSDYLKGIFGFQDVPTGDGADSAESIANNSADPTDPTNSATNVMMPELHGSPQDTLYAYAQANNSASAYEQWLANEYNSNMANTEIQRRVADAEAAGISKYQLFQSGNAGASSPSSATGAATSYEKSLDRKNSMNEKELAALVSIITSAINSAGKIIASK